MAMNIKDPEAERLAAEIAELTGESKTAAVRGALRARRDRLVAERDAECSGEELLRFLRDEIWPLIPEHEKGRPRMTKTEREEILGIGPEGV
ncbi:MAG: protein transcription factor [Pseudonocardiaceae bacterium]|nr:protein transcription factor [Pseudonocardiaceae bacterium]